MEQLSNKVIFGECSAKDGEIEDVVKFVKKFAK